MLGIGPLITAVTRHRVSANVIMMVFLLCGALALVRLPVRFFPPFEINVVTVFVFLDGASATEIEESVVIPLENSLRNVPNFKKIYSYSRENSGTVVLEFPDDVDVGDALEEVKTEADRVNLPADAESPRVELAKFDIKVANITVVGTHPAELRQTVRRLESDLNIQGLGEVSVTGLPEEEILVLVDQQKLIEMNLSLAQIGQAIGARNSNSSVGTLGGFGSERKLKTDSKTSDFKELYSMPVAKTPDGSVVYLRDIAHLTRREVSDQVSVLYNGQPAATLSLETVGVSINMLDIADDLNAWIAKQQQALPENVRLVAHEEEWRAVQSRLSLLINNGLAGMLLVVAILYLFLSRQVALWVAAGIPIAMFGTLFVFYINGGTINMISMFALIMALGIIVDDAIVVGENAQYRLSRGDPPMRAVISAARTMFTPVFASSFTTIAAFLPLFLISGTIGAIIFDIPMIIVCILIAALIECFLVLPGHLYRSFAKRAMAQPGVVRRGLDNGFDAFREKIFRPTARFAVRHALFTVTCCVMLMYLSIAMLQHGFVGYRFFPGAEGNVMFGSVGFSSGTPRATMEAYVEEMIAALEETDQQLDPDSKLVAHVNANLGVAGDFQPPGDESALLIVELVEADARTVKVSDFVTAWKDNLRYVPGITKLDVRGESGGPPGRDIEVRLTAPDVAQIKPASQRVRDVLEKIPGLTSVADDTPYGKEQVIFELTPLGRSLDVDIRDLAVQLRHAVDGYKVQTFTEGIDETDLKVKLADFDSTNVLRTFYVRLPSGEYAPLNDIAVWRTEQGFDSIQHQFGLPAIVVTADLDPDAPTTVNEVLDQLEQAILLDLYNNEGILYSFEGKTADEQKTAQEMMTGLVLALALIFIILTWVFNSWTMPFVVMLTMPMGVIGTIIGHWVMGLSMSILSFFGMFTLMGILVNNSIVLVNCFKELGADDKNGAAYNEAIVEASCLRLRPVLLTSLTTIGGLLPLMFETSLQAQFLLPMAISICFGLAFATALILLYTPACMAIHGSIARSYHRLSASVERRTLKKSYRT